MRACGPYEGLERDFPRSGSKKWAKGIYTGKNTSHLIIYFFISITGNPRGNDDSWKRGEGT
jgi:hypothetical protein